MRNGKNLKNYNLHENKTPGVFEMLRVKKEKNETLL